MSSKNTVLFKKSRREVAMLDPYQTLGVDKSAGPDEIKSAYRKASKQAHPDTGGSAEKFASLNGAYLVLKDPEKRAEYDRTGEVPGGGPETLISMALNEISKLLKSAIQEDVKKVKLANIQAQMVNFFKCEIEKIETQRNELRRRCDVATEIAERMIEAGDGPAYIEMILSGQKADINRHIKAADDKEEVLLMALDILEDCSYRFDAPPQWQATSFYGGPTQTTATST